jgi:integrase
MPLLNLTDAALRNLKTQKRQTFFDTSTPGFGVRCTPAGVKTFVIIYGPEKARKWEVIGRYDPRHLTLAKARKEGGDRLAAIRLGIKTDTPDLGFEEAYAQFLAHYQAKNRPKTVYEMERIVKRHLMPKFKRKMAADVSTADLTGIIDKLLDTPAECFATFVAARTIFRWLARRRTIERSPLENVPAPAQPIPRARVLTDHELRIVWQTCVAQDNLNPEFCRIVRLLMLTGQRESQIAKLQGEWIGRAHKRVAWPAAAMKNKREHTIPLAPLAFSIVASLPKEGYVFKARDKDKPFNGFSKCKAAFDERAQIAPWTLHDLRRTFSTGIAKLGVLPHIKEMLLAHSTAKDPVEAVYDLHKYESEMKSALQLWENHLQDLLSHTEGSDVGDIPRPHQKRPRPAKRGAKSARRAAA